MKKDTAVDIFIGLGTNLGNREQNLRAALVKIKEYAGDVISKSSIYETEPWGYTDQPIFLNAVIKIRSLLTPETLLDTLLSIEKEMGRTRSFKNAARIIDLDLLFYGDKLVHIGRLTIPHPFISERNFVLQPLAEIAADWVHPALKKTISELLSESRDPLQVQRIGML